MRTTVTIDDELLAKAKKYAGVEETSALLKIVMKSYIEGEASRRLALMGGTEPDLDYIPRRRPAE